MRIKYKLIIIFILIIITSSLPLTLYNLTIQEREVMDLLRKEGRINTQILAKSSLNIILMNGGNINSIRVDSTEMVEAFKNISSAGLIYTETVLLSDNPAYNGTILSSLKMGKTGDKLEFFKGEKKSLDEMIQLKNHPGFKEIDIPDVGKCFEFVELESFDGKPVCSARMLFSKKDLTRPFAKMRRLVYVSTLAAIGLTMVFALILSRVYTRPIYRLISEVKKFEAGDIDYAIHIRSNDEIGKLSRTFNDFARILKLQINGLIETNKNLKRIDVLKDEFLANVSHELRAPLHGIIGITESLLDGVHGRLDPDIEHNLSLVYYGGKRLTGLVNELLDFSRLKNNDIILTFSSVDLYSIVYQVLEILKPDINAKGLMVSSSVRPNDSLVYGDEDRLLQIVLYVVENAVKFTDKGEIRIETTRIDDGSGDVMLSITDTGIGIPGEILGNIFEMIQKDVSTNRGYSGVGLGLAITRRLVELHGGTISVQSEEGKGSVFNIRLKPANSRYFEETRTSKDVEAALAEKYSLIQSKIPDNKFLLKNATKGTVWVVDDERVSLQFLINNLIMDDFYVVAFTSGTDALEMLISEGPPDIMLIDIMMPKLSGYEVCRILRDKYTQYDLPVVMLSAKGRLEDIVAGLRAGANDYLVKPINKMELLVRVNNLLSMKKSLLSRDELNKLKRDMEIAHEIQKSILYAEIPANSLIDMHLRYVPMYELGGDFYDIRSLVDNVFNILIADVSGHGIAAALICSMLKVTYAFNLAIDPEPDKIMTNINRSMYDYLKDNFITALYAYIDMNSKKMFYSNAGHWPAIIYRKSTGEILSDEQNGIPIGWTDDSPYERHEYDLLSGDRVVFFTDLFVEIRNSEKIMFGVQRLIDLIKEGIDKPPKDFAGCVFDTVRAWSGMKENVSFPDDATLIVIDIA